MSNRFDLTDKEWAIIQPLLPNKPRGVPRVEDRTVLNGIFWVLRTGAPWEDMPVRYGPPYDCIQSLQSLAQGRVKRIRLTGTYSQAVTSRY